MHCNALSDEEFRLIADSGATALVSPELELRMAVGPVAIRRLLAVGVEPSLSVDTCLNIGGELFSVMRAALSSVREEVNAERITDGTTPDTLPLSTRDVLRWATLEGARANGLDQETGTLTVGKRADIVALNARRPNLAPISHPTGSVVMGANPSNVEMVMVDGTVLKRAFQLVNTDHVALAARAQARQHDMLDRLGVRFESGVLRPHPR